MTDETQPWVPKVGDRVQLNGTGSHVTVTKTTEELVFFNPTPHMPEGANSRISATSSQAMQ